MDSNLNSNSNYIFVDRILQYLLGSISVLFNSIIIFSFIFSRNKQLYTFELIFYLCISSLINNIGTFIIMIVPGESYNSTLCRIQAFLLITSEMSVIIFATIISIHCYISIKNYYLIDHIEKRRKLTRFIIVITGFGIPLTISTFFQLFDIVGVSDIWCLINNEYVVAEIIYLTFIWIFLIVSTIFACMSFNENQVNLRDGLNKENYVKMLYLYPIICYITWVVTTINRISFYINDKEWNNIIVIIDIIVFQLQGCGYGVTFLYTNKVKAKEAAYNIIRTKCACCFKGVNDSHDDLSNYIESAEVNDYDYFDMRGSERIDEVLRSEKTEDIRGSERTEDILRRSERTEEVSIKNKDSQI